MNKAIGEPEYNTHNMKPQPYGPIRADHCINSVVAELSVTALKGPVKGPDKDTQSVYNVLEEPYLEGAKGGRNYGAMSPEGPVDNTFEGPVTSMDLQPVYGVLEEPYTEGAKEVSYNGAMTSEGPIYSTLEESYSDNVNATNDSEIITNEPIYNVIEEEHYVGIINKR